jgi:hypothetical protein
VLRSHTAPRAQFQWLLGVGQPPFVRHRKNVERPVWQHFLIVILRAAPFADRRTYGVVGSLAATGRVHNSFVAQRRGWKTGNEKLGQT